MECKYSGPSLCRLDELSKTCSFPVAVQIVTNETTLNETYNEDFSSEDVIVIDSKRTQHKVAATFWKDSDTVSTDDRCKSSDPINEEILIPLNYQGKLKVKSEIKSYGNFGELSRDFPRYAKVCQTVAVISANGQPLIIPSGTVLELDRIIPGLKRNFTVFSDQLVIRFDHQGKPVEVTVSVTTQGLFQTEPDNNEYTIKEAVDKYHLPQVVTFLDDDIIRVYSHELKAKSKSITVSNTLTLNRLVTQDVLVGHYVPVGHENYNITEHCRQRTLVVIPLDDSVVMTTKFKVCNDAIKDKICKSIRNLSDDTQLLEKAIYVNFASTSGIDRISLQTLTAQSEIIVPIPVPRTTRSSTLPHLSSSAPTNSYIAAGRTLNQHSQTLPHSTRQSERCTLSSVDVGANDAVIPKSPAHQNHIICGYDSLAELRFDVLDAEEWKIDEGKTKKNMIRRLMKSPSKLTSTLRRIIKKTHNNPEHPVTPVHPVDYLDETAPDITDDSYSQIDESLMIRPTSVKALKPFKTLTREELNERLRKCGMDDFASVCKVQCLDGHYLSMVTTDDLVKFPFNLTHFELFKFERIKENWVPT